MNYLFLLGLLVGALLVAGAGWPLLGYLRQELVYYRRELATAQDRLLYAWRDDKVVPAPRPIDAVPEKPLPPELMDVVNEWESPDARAAAEKQLRHLYFNREWGVQAILKHLQDEGLHV